MINLLQQSLDRRRIVKGGVAAGAAMAFNPFSRLVSAQEAEDLPTDASDMEALIAGAQKENKIVSYGMPDYWANLGEIWETFMEKYNIAEHEDADLSSAQEIAKFLAEAENRSPISATSVSSSLRPRSSSGSARHSRTTPGTRSPIGRSTPMGCGPSSTTGIWSSWSTPISSIPFPARSRICSSPTMPTASASAIHRARRRATSPSSPRPSPMAATRRCATGARLLQAARRGGQLKSTDPDLANFQKGETVIGFLWDYLALEYRDELEGQVNLEIVVPEDASIAGPYASIINKFAPHPYAARLLRNYILSPEGQALYAEGYATPILPDVEIPEEVAAKRPSGGGLRQRAHDQ